MFHDGIEGVAGLDADGRHREAEDLFRSLLAAVEALDGRSQDDAPPQLSEEGLHVAAAVVLLQMIQADHEVHQDEHRALGRSLHRVLGLEEEIALHVIRRAEDEMARNAPFRDVVALLDRHCPRDFKKKVVHCLWRIAYADAELAVHEEYLVRKVAEQLHLETGDLIETKLRAREEFLTDT